MQDIQRRALTRGFWTVLMAGFVWAAGASIGAAQFRLPKVPGNSNKETKPSQSGSPEVSTVSPDSAPPGGHGEVVLTGKNFQRDPTVQYQLKCKGADFSLQSAKAESDTRLVAQVTAPLNVEEGPCDLMGKTFQSWPISKGAFSISNAAQMPVDIALMMVGEGDMQFQDFMMAMSKAMMATAQTGGKAAPSMLELEGTTIKYVQGDTTSFTKPFSAVKSLEQIQMYGQPSPYFRIAFNDGKIYNFAPTVGSGAPGDPNATFAFLKKKLGK